MINVMLFKVFLGKISTSMCHNKENKFVYTKNNCITLQDKQIVIFFFKIKHSIKILMLIQVTNFSKTNKN